MQVIVAAEQRPLRKREGLHASVHALHAAFYKGREFNREEHDAGWCKVSHGRRCGSIAVHEFAGLRVFAGLDCSLGHAQRLCHA